jgi:hypothetical protein
MHSAHSFGLLPNMSVQAENVGAASDVRACTTEMIRCAAAPLDCPTEPLPLTRLPGAA